jgi:ribosomal-protein-alanine N-acetyltransferase
VITKDSEIAAAPLSVPILFVPPYRLRPFAAADLDLVRETSADPDIPLMTTVPAVFSETEGIAFIERQWSRARVGQRYPFVIADAATDRGIGAIGLNLRNLDEGRASIYYWVVRSARGRGAAPMPFEPLRRGPSASCGSPALNWLSSLGMSHPSSLRNVAAFAGKGSCERGSRSGINAAICSCIRAFRATVRTRPRAEVSGHARLPRRR